jgi:hypothetical protein
MNFNQNDKEKVIEFLNLIALKADFNNMSVKDNIKLFGLLSFMQKTLIDKIDNNLLEVTKYVPPAEPKPKKAKS